jgi:toxin ParE1/3/4
VKVRWVAAARQDRRQVMSYIAADNPQAAAKMDELFDLAATRLGKRPRLGRPGRIPGTRELIPHESYRLVYEIEDETVWILALVHTSRQWPPAEK